MDRMDESSGLEKEIGRISLAGKVSASNYDMATETSIQILKCIDDLVSSNREMDKRLSVIETKVTTMEAKLGKPKRNSSALCEDNTIGDRYVKPAIRSGRGHCFK